MGGANPRVLNAAKRGRTVDAFESLEARGGQVLKKNEAVIARNNSPEVDRTRRGRNRGGHIVVVFARRRSPKLDRTRRQIHFRGNVAVVFARKVGSEFDSTHRGRDHVSNNWGRLLND